VSFHISLRDEIWVILGHHHDEDGEGEDDEMILWKCLHRRILMVPPRDGWVPVDELARGKRNDSLEVPTQPHSDSSSERWLGACRRVGSRQEKTQP
jgi:hypothetical protein